MLVEEVRGRVSECKICSEIKPIFYHPPKAELIKATQPFGWLSLDFKGPLPTSSKNRFLLTVVDECFRFLFAFPCANTDAKTVIACLSQLFTLFDMTNFIHSDRGPAQ